MAKDGRMVLKDAHKLLQEKGYTYSLSALKNAARDGRLKAEKMEDPLAFYLVSETDLILWADDPEKHRIGRPKTKATKGSK